MSGTEDGQLRSPGDVNMFSGDEEHDTDSLDIKPPQASVIYLREGSGVRRKQKPLKEKKHSKEKKHKERVNEDEGIERERRNDVERRGHRREIRFEADVMRYHRGGDEGEENREMIPHNERRPHKYYDRSGDMAGGHENLGQQNYHHHQPPPPYHHLNQIHMQRHRHVYYNERRHGYGIHYNRHPHGSHLEYQHPHQYDIGMQRERRNYNFENQNDPESLEQDLRSRLLKKRHKYVTNESDEYYNEQQGDRPEGEEECFEKDYEEHKRVHEKRTKKSQHHKPRRVKKRDSIIEVLDSPDVGAQPHKKQRKIKRHNKERNSDAEKRKTPDDPELIARRAKLLAAEREKEKRKEVAREELEARRELRREQNDVVDELSPTAVAANVTAGLNIIKQKQNIVGESSKKQTFFNRTPNDAMEEDGDVEDIGGDSDIDVDAEKGSNGGCGSELAESSYSKKKKAKIKSKAQVGDDSEGSIPLSHSSVSRGDLSKSPQPRRSRKKQRKSRTPLSDDDLESLLSHSSHSGYSSSSHSSLHTASRSSRSSRHSASRSMSSHSYRSSDDRSRSHSPINRSHSRSFSRSRTRSEERGMKTNAEKTDNAAKEKRAKTNAYNRVNGSPHRDFKGRLLPNYFPGIQGCRSVEEFQCLNRIEEGTYGVVYRAKDKRTDEIVALKRLKMEREKEGFPITSLREINTLLKAQHPNIVTVREIVVGSNMDKIFIVMDYVEHDLKSLMETMKNRKQRFFPGEVKCLIQQLLQAVKHLHDNWILHRDLKTSNLLLSHKGILKVGDFGLAREYGSPLKHYTSCVVTLWYRAPELLLGPINYSTPIDIWSVGCIFGEFLQMSALFPGQSEIEQLNRIFKILGTPNEKIWPGYNNLPAVKNLISQNSQFADYPVSNLPKYFADKTTEYGISLLQSLLTYNPKTRLSADTALAHPFFKELPLPIDPSMFPTWPAKSELGTRKAASPKPPPSCSEIKGGDNENATKNNDTNASNTSSANTKVMSGIITGNKKAVTNTGFVLNAGMDQRQVTTGQGFNLKF